MEFDKVRYVTRGIPRIDDSFIEAMGNVPKIEEAYESFRVENAPLALALDNRARKVEKNLPAKMLTLTFPYVVDLAEREFRLMASIAYTGLYTASEAEAQLSEVSGLPLLTESMGKNFEENYKHIRKSNPNADIFLQFLRSKDLKLFDLISMDSSWYGGGSPRPEREFSMRDTNSAVRFVNERGNLGAETIYDFLRKKNQSNRLREQFEQ